MARHVERVAIGTAACGLRLWLGVEDAVLGGGAPRGGGGAVEKLGGGLRRVGEVEPGEDD